MAKHLSDAMHITLILVGMVLLLSSCGQDTRSREAGKIVQVDPELTSILSKDTRLQKLVGGFGLLEGPVWGIGYLLFSDMRSHVIHKWHPTSGLSTYLKTSVTRSGPNGLAFDKDGRLTMCEHGNRRVSRLERDGSLTVLAEYYNGKRLNSPNDLVYRSDGLLYFTDPPFGLKDWYANPEKELPFSGIFLLSDGKLQLLTDELSGPNGLTLSPDEKYLYIGDYNHRRPVIHRYQLKSDGTLSQGEIFFNAGALAGVDALDGMKSDIHGNLYVTASTGVIFISSTGKYLGTLEMSDTPTNLAWGDEDRKGLYITGEKSLYRIRTHIPGSRNFRSSSN
jgi:gluconolactonase